MDCNGKWEVTMNQWENLLVNSTKLAEEQKFQEAIEVTEQAEDVVQDALLPSDITNPAIEWMSLFRAHIYGRQVEFLKEKGLLEQAKEISVKADRCRKRQGKLVEQDMYMVVEQGIGRMADNEVLSDIWGTMWDAIYLVGQNGNINIATHLVTLLCKALIQVAGDEF